MFQFVLAGLLAIGGVEVDVRLLNETSHKGEIVGLTEETLLLKSASGGDLMLKIHDLESIAPTTAPAPAIREATIRVELVDGSILAATSFDVSKGQANIGAVDREPLAIPTRSIQSVLLLPLDAHPDLQRSWSDIEQAKRTGDTIVIRKDVAVENADDPDGAVRMEVVLNSLDGVLRDVSDISVSFHYDGSTVPVDRPRVQGFFYFHPVKRELRDPICRVVDADGCQWSVRSLETDGEKISIVTPAGVAATINVDRIKAFDFTAGNTIYLSDISPARIEWKPYFESVATAASLEKLYRPRMNQAFDGGQLRIYDALNEDSSDGASKPELVKTFDKGIAMHSRTRLEYLLPGEFKRLVAVAGIDERVRERGNVRLVITGDGKTMYEGTISGKDPSPAKLNLDLTGVRRLAILVDYGDALDIGDYLNLCKARITK